MTATAPTPPPIPLTTIAELRQHHSQLVRLGLASHPAHARRLLAFLAHDPAAHLPYAARLLVHHPDPHPALFNPLFAALPPRHAARLLAVMLSLPLPPDHFTFPRILPAAPLPLVTQLHALLLKLGFHSHAQSLNALLAAYLANALPDLASRVFHTTTSRTLDVVSWTTMVGGLCKLGLVDEARKVFGRIPVRNLISWNAMISGYVKAGRFLDALDVFDEMRALMVEGNGFVAASAVVACTGAGALARGREVHRWVEQSGIEIDKKLATAVVDMYCKCGCLEEAWRLFEALPVKGLTSWMELHDRRVRGARAGRGRRQAVRPDGEGGLDTGRGHAGERAHSLRARGDGQRGSPLLQLHCSEIRRRAQDGALRLHGGLVRKSRAAGRSQEGDRRHADGAGRRRPRRTLWSVQDTRRRRSGRGDRVEPDPQNSGRYVLLANLVARAGRWEDVAKVRRLMDERNVSKEAGRSVIEVDGEVCEFQCGSLRDPQAAEVYATARDMMSRIGAEGYAPDTRDMLHDVAEEEEEAPLLYHGEKLAFAFELLRTRPGDTIRITKEPAGLSRLP